MDAARGGHEADARLGKAQARRLPGHDDVAGKRDLEATAEGDAVHRGDQRLPQVVARDEPAEPAFRHARHAVLRRPLEVVAGGEGAIAGAGENRDPDVGVVGDVVPHTRQLLVGRRVQRVHDFRPVDGDDRDVVALLVADELELHRGSSLPAPRTERAFESNAAWRAFLLDGSPRRGIRSGHHRGSMTRARGGVFVTACGAGFAGRRTAFARITAAHSRRPADPRRSLGSMI